jgi:Ni/Co efflux regulator RcnB
MKLAAQLAAAVAVALALTTASAAMADPRHDRDDRWAQPGRDDRGRDARPQQRREDRRDDRRDDRYDRRDDRRDDRYDRRDDRRDRWDDRRYRDRWYRDHGWRHPGPYYRPYGYAPRRWQRGARLPAAYYAPRYVIHDHYAYRLRPPPRGCHWVRVDGDAVLAAIATGVVLDVLYGYFG